VNEPHWNGEASVQEREASPLDSLSVQTVHLSHGEVRAQLTDYFDGSLDAIKRRLIEAHLEECRDCRAFRDTLRQTVHLLDSLPLQRVPSSARQRIQDQVRENAPKP
jgi:predicted anti-sigma-YlaC factor YlaD